MNEPTLFKEAYDDAITRLRVDPKRVYVAGISYGGEGVFHFANTYPTLVAAGLSIAASSPIASATLCANLGPNNVALWGLINRGDVVFGSTAMSQTVSDLRACGSYTDVKAKPRLTVFTPVSYPNTGDGHGSAENISLQLPWYTGVWKYWDGSAEQVDTTPPTHPASFAFELQAANPGNTLDAPIIPMDSFATTSTDLGVSISNLYDYLLYYKKP